MQLVYFWHTTRRWKNVEFFPHCGEDSWIGSFFKGLLSKVNLFLYGASTSRLTHPNKVPKVACFLNTIRWLSHCFLYNVSTFSHVLGPFFYYYWKIGILELKVGFCHTVLSLKSHSSSVFFSSPNQNWDRRCQIRFSTQCSWKWNGGIEVYCPSSQTQSSDCLVPWECRILQR